MELASRPPSNGKKKMVCHDLAGNYHDDACFQGSWSLHYYNFWEWRSIDIFVYFSHYMISIPPVGWINTGHRNGVKVWMLLVIFTESLHQIHYTHARWDDQHKN